MTDGYLSGAVNQYKASKTNFFRRNKPHLGPLSLKKCVEIEKNRR